MHARETSSRLPALVIANPHAGHGRARRDLTAVTDGLRAALGGIDVACTRHPGHASELAAAAAREGRELIVCFGGDGTLSEIAHGLLGDSDTPAPATALPLLALVPSGTGSDFGRSLGLPSGLRDGLLVVTGGGERLVDAGWAKFDGGDGTPRRRIWLNVLSAGLGGYVDRYTAAAPAILPGTAAYAQATLRAIVACRRVPIRCRAVFPDGSRAEKLLRAYAVVVCNGTTFGAGMRVAPMARPDDGLLDVITVETASKLRMLLRLSTVYRGRHLTQPGISHFSCRQLTLTPVTASGGPFPLDVDGDALGAIPVDVGILPAALRISVPASRHVPG